MDIGMILAGIIGVGIFGLYIVPSILNKNEDNEEFNEEELWQVPLNNGESVFDLIDDEENSMYVSTPRFDPNIVGSDFYHWYHN